VIKYKWLRAVLCLLILFFNATTLLAQEEEEVKMLVESLAENLPDDYDLTDLVEQLNHYKKYPINLNETDPETLKNLVFLSPLQISNFFSHLKSNGKLLDLLELQSIDDFDLNTIQRLLPFVTLKLESPLKKITPKELLTKGHNDLILRLAQTVEQQKGFQDLPGSRYLGSPEKILGKYRYSYNDLISASLVFKKDAGEYLFSGNNKSSFDFLSAHLSINNMGKIKKLVLGDYSLQFGQGLTMWSGFGYGKGPDVTSVAKKDVGLRAYTSSNEASFFRGLAGTFEFLENVQFTTFFSYRNLDASLTLKPDELPTLVNLGVSGLHRTATEIRNKKSQGQMVFGAAVQYLSNNLSIGAVAYESRYKHAFVTGNLDYNQNNFTGNLLRNAGLHYNYTFINIYFYGEGASSLDGGFSIVNGAMASLSRKLSAVVVQRYYDQGYHSFFSQSLGENSEGGNEVGFYAGLNLVPNKRWSFSIYSDYFKFPFLKYRIDAPSNGYEVLSQMNYTPSKTFKGIIRFKIKVKAQNPDDKLSESVLDNINKANYRLGVDWRLSRKFSFQNRVEAVHYKKGPVRAEIGYLIYQDVNYKPLSSRLSGNFRLAYFNTSFNSRVYAYEDDVLYGFSFGLYNGKGYRTYYNLKYNLTKKVSMWTRYAISWYPNEETVGSGLDLIAGNKKSEVKVQLRYEF
jgi:hypothetical protein